jgi:putative heme-binding domain-containing protein
MPTAFPDKREPEPESEMQRLRDMKLLSGAPSRRPVKALVNPYNPETDLTARARSYLHVNCAHCHSRNAGGSVPSLMTYHLHPEKMHMMEEVPLQGSFGIQDARVIAKGDPFRSALYYRISKIGRSRMPHLASYRVDREGVELIYQWIRNMVSPGLEDTFNFSARNFREKGLISTSGALRYLRAVDRGLLAPEFAEKVVDAGSRHDAIPIRELFDRFLPEEKRSKLLGSRINPDDILQLEGDSDRGRNLFFASDGMQCQACHQINGQGRFMGPDLSKIGSRYTPELILESIMNPSAVIAPEFKSYLIETTDDELYSGFIVERTESGVVMRDTVSQIIEIPSTLISSMDAQTVSLMPEQLLRDVTAQDAADLVAYLSVLK